MGSEPTRRLAPTARQIGERSEENLRPYFGRSLMMVFQGARLQQNTSPLTISLDSVSMALTLNTSAMGPAANGFPDQCFQVFRKTNHGVW